jgi:hypothetical protein
VPAPEPSRRQPDGELAFRHPHGYALPYVPPRIEIPHDPFEPIRVRNMADGFDVKAHAARPGWSGERLDVGYAIDVLHPLAGNG